MQRPVAQVAVDVPLPHLDRPFDYAVPDELDDACQRGCRVRVRFAGRRVGGYVLAREPASTHPGPLAPLALVSAESVVSAEVAVLARALADRNAGTMADVLRLAVPPRHARVEAAPAPEPSTRPEPPDPGTWSDYPAGVPFLHALATGGAPRAVWSASPGDRWPAEIATAVAATLAGGRGVVVVVPDARDLARLEEALLAILDGPGRHVVLSERAGPAERYRRFLAVRRGAVAAAIGPRAAAFAPVRRVGLVVVWDEGDDALDERRAPYGTTRDTLVLRAHLAGAAALIGSYAPSVAAHALLDNGWAHPLLPGRAALRAAAPRISAAGGDTDLARDPAARAARLPTRAWQAAARGLAEGPVLVQVPRRGYQPALSCQECRAAARCGHCAGPIGRPAMAAPPTCRWCARLAADWRCRECGSPRLRAAVVGGERTAEELGRSFPGFPLRTSFGQAMLDAVGPEPALVVATPGAEPVAIGGYAAVLLLDGWALLGRPGLRAGEEALRRWANAAALARPAPCGHVVVMADGGLPVVSALLHWEPAAYARQEAAERRALGFPPATRLAAVDGAPTPLTEMLAAVRADPQLPAAAEVLGPVGLSAEQERALVRVPRADGAALAHALKSALAQRSARKAADSIRVELDPREPL